jgi:hypothetical protein
MSLNRKFLSIYLNDHLAGSTVGCDLARRALGSNRDNEFGTFLEWLREEIEEDRQTLRDLMRRLDVGEDRVKRVVAFVTERAGRLKLNGALFGYSPLSRLVELEGLSLGVEGKLAMWTNLGELPQEEGLEEFDFEHLADRAREQRQGLEEHRLKASRIAFVE